MKSTRIPMALLMGTIIFTACNGDSSETSSTTDSSSMTTTGTGTDNTGGTNTDAGGSMTNSQSNMALSDMDKAFVMKAAKGGMMEVESSRIAQESGGHQRVKDVATMIMRDHTNANNELKGLVSARGIIIPEDSLMALNKSHIDDMQKMKGKALDKHYISMMTDDHKKDIAEFEKASNELTDPELKAWATKSLPVLKMHRDSVAAISKIKM